jgi:chromosomal replication initiator protein
MLDSGTVGKKGNRDSLDSAIVDNVILDQATLSQATSENAEFAKQKASLATPERSDSLMTARHVWAGILGALEADTDKQIFDAYFRPLVLDAVDVENSEVTIAAPSRFLCERVDSMYRDKLAAVLVTSLGLDRISLKFRVDSSLIRPAQQTKAPTPTLNGPRQTPLTLVRNGISKGLDASAGAQRPAGDEGSSAPILSGVNPRYTFANFVVGSSNQFCHAAAQKVAEAPALSYNPFFIYGGVGLGKTHLLHAIGNQILAQNPVVRIAYMSAESFMNDLIQSLRRGRMDDFKTRMRAIEVLLIDDIQFICGKERTQEEFFHTFNALYNAKCQIVITSDKMPHEITGLEERLKTRFAWGLMADLQSPDFETRVAILNKKAAAESFFLPQDVARLIAESISSNVRELEGALTRLHAVSSLQNAPITIELTEVVLKPLLQPKSFNITIDDIKSAVVEQFGLKVSDLSSKRRTRNLSFPRHIAMYLCRKHTTASYPEIGVSFGGRDHSSVIHAANVVAKKIAADQETRSLVDRIERELVQ